MAGILNKKKQYSLNMKTPSPAKENDPCWKVRLLFCFIVVTDTKHRELISSFVLQERQLTYKCLDDNNYDKDKCMAFIKNGKYCKTFWVNDARFNQ